nr:hypothetical protein [Kofleriaceae bacterium]
MIASLAFMRRYHAHEQRAFPLATLVLTAAERSGAQRIRLLALAEREAEARAREYGIPSL